MILAMYRHNLELLAESLGVQDLGNQDQIAPDRNSTVLFVGLEAEEKSRSWPPPPFDFEAQFAWK